MKIKKAKGVQHSVEGYVCAWQAVPVRLIVSACLQIDMLGHIVATKALIILQQILCKMDWKDNEGFCQGNVREDSKNFRNVPLVLNCI